MDEISLGDRHFPILSQIKYIQLKKIILYLAFVGKKSSLLLKFMFICSIIPGNLLIFIFIRISGGGDLFSAESYSFT